MSHRFVFKELLQDLEKTVQGMCIFKLLLGNNSLAKSNDNKFHQQANNFYPETILFTG